MPETEQETIAVSAMEKKMLEKADFELLSIKLSDLGSSKVPGKLYEYAFKKYLKDNGLDNEITTPQELAMYFLMKKLEAAENAPHTR